MNYPQESRDDLLSYGLNARIYVPHMFRVFRPPRRVSTCSLHYHTF